jgi:hypothetical protein
LCASLKSLVAPDDHVVVIVLNYRLLIGFHADRIALMIDHAQELPRI